MNDQAETEENDDLVEAFRELKADDETNVPPFSLPEIPERRWKLRTTSVVAWAAGAAAALAVAVTIITIPDPGPAQPGNVIAFDDLSEVISRELFVSSASQWQSPTSFLLKPE